ncbi:TRAF-type zinc finger domain-containing protein 1, partial [Trichonephila clavata]
EEEIYCGDCGLKVAEKYFAIHASVCKGRELYAKDEEEVYCVNCGFMVAVKFFAVHLSVCKGRELYAKDMLNKDYNCEMCGLKVPLNNVDFHMSMCQSSTSLRKSSVDIVCEYCQEEIPSKFYEKHIMICRTQKEKCLVCDELVMVQDKKLHLEICGKSSEENKIACEFCEVKVPFHAYEDHVFICGTVKVKCPICNENVMAQDQKRHLEICRRAAFSIQIPCKYCNKSIPEDDFEDHVLSCGSRTEKCEKCNKYVVLKEKEMHPFVCKTISRSHGNCRYCHEVVSWLDMNIHEAACAIENGIEDYTHQNMLNELSLKKSSPFEKYTSNDDRSNQVCGKRCPFCVGLFLQSLFPKHLECCEERPYNCSACLKAMPYKEKEKHTILCYGNKEKKGHFEAVALYEENKSFVKGRQIEKLKQCEFCDERLPDLIFETHLGTCSKRHEKCKLCNTSVLVKEMKNHLSNCSFDKHYDSRYFDCDKYLYAGNMPASSMNSVESKYLEDNVEVCPSCKCKIPVVRFACHAQYCLEDMKSCKFCGSKIKKKDERNHLQNCKRLLDVGKDFTPQSEKKEIKNKSRNDGESFLGTVGRLLQNKWKKEESMEEIQNKYAPQGRQNRRKIQESVIPNQLLQHEIPLVPCEFCDELYPFELLIEHQSGCRPDLTSFPKKDGEGTVGSNMQVDDKSQGSYRSIASGNSKKIDTEWTEISSRKSRKISTKKSVLAEQESVESSSGRNKQLSKESGFSGSSMQYRQHFNRDKYFYYQPPGYAETERNYLDVKHSSELNQCEETSKIACAEESDSVRLHKVFRSKDSFPLYKSNSSANTKENYNSSNEQALGSPTSDEHDQHQVKNNNDYHYQVFPSLPNDEKSILSKVVGAERIVKGGVINKTKNVALGFIYENSKAPIDQQVVSDNHTIEKNLAMKTVWNTECDTSDIQKKIAESNNEKEVECDLSNVEMVSNIFEDKTHTSDKNSTNEQLDNDVNKDSEMNAYFKYLSCNNDRSFDMKERVVEKEKLASGSTENCDCGNQICYCAIAKQSSLAKNSLSRENSHLKNFQPDSCSTISQDMLSDDNEPKPMEVDSPFEEINAMNQVVQKKDSSEINNCIEVEK